MVQRWLVPDIGASALVALAKEGAATLGRRIPRLGVDPQALAELEADGIVRYVRIGQTVRFVHDIYFEWSFLQLLVSEGDQWLSVIRQVGEPPVLGRVVELLSQTELKDGVDWQKYLELLEGATDVRSQWLRAWLVGPFGLPSFWTHESMYTAAMLVDGARRVAKLAVWFQAEKTKANPLALDGKAFPDLELAQRLRIADSLAVPSDIDTWRRCCYWLLRRIDDVPTSIRPHLVTVFEVWQNAVADVPNRVSKAIVNLAKSWLTEIEARTHNRAPSQDTGGWEQLKRGDLRELEERLRAILLRAGRAYSAEVLEYLEHLQAMERVPGQTVEQVLAYGPVLSEVCPTQLVNFGLRVMMRPLPEEVVRRLSGSPHNAIFAQGIEAA